MEKEYYKEYYHLERSHWWFKARLLIIEAILKNKIGSTNNKRLKILNAGVATGATTTMLEKYGEVTSLEYEKDCCEFLKTVVEIDAINGSLTALPFEDDSYDLVCAFDVVEHIEDDTLAIQEIKRVLKNDGLMYLTVPAFNFLWSHHDVVNHHFRRYTRSNLKKLVKAEGFSMELKTYFNFFLFFPIFIVRMLSHVFSFKKKSEETTGSDFELFNTNGLVNTIMYQIFKAEKWFLKKNITFPVGVSILMIGRKQATKQ